MFGSELIEDRVRNPKQKGPAIVPFITAGYPHKDDFLSLVQALADCADVIEIGVPFSDPMADGVTIQRSSHLAIESGVRLRWILNQLKTISINTPIILMSYLNPLYVYGYTQLAQDSKDAGVDGFIVPDLPIEEGEELREILKLAGLGMIQLVTPATPEDRIKKIAAKETRRLGLGVMGIADMLNQLGYGYDSDEGVAIIKKVMHFICNVAVYVC